MIRRKEKFYFKSDIHTRLGYAVLANRQKFLQQKHAYKVFKFLSACGCKVYLVAQDLDRLEGKKVYGSLKELKGKVDVVIPCLMPEYIPDLVEITAESGARYIWFQERNWTPEFQQLCDNCGIETLRGCTLKHKIFSKPFAFLHPCYWHGLKESKVPDRFS